MPSLRLLVAPDSFKGCLTAPEVAAAFARGWRRARPEDEIDLAPLADGGEGTLEAIAAGGGWEWQESDCHDPLNRRIRARWLRSSDGGRAVVELAEASGLSRVAEAERRPRDATTRGTGELLRAVLDAGVRRVILGIGGSATTDGGLGLLAALGPRIDRFRSSVGGAPPGPAQVRIDLGGLDPRLGDLELRVACDVTNPLLGERGAAAVYGPQKGASAADVAALDEDLALWADALEGATGRRERETPGAGAAGGVGFALLCLRGRLRSLDFAPGVELLMDETGFAARLARADLVVTGEGRIDAQTAFGKTALGVARRASEAGVPCLAVGGAVTAEGTAALAEAGALAFPIAEGPISLADAMARAPELLERAGERLGRLVKLDVGVRSNR